MLKRLMAFVCILMTILFVSVAVAQKSPEKIRLAADSKDGALLIRVPSQPFPYALQFSKNGKSGFGSRVYIMKVGPGNGGSRYISRTLSPGRYRLDSVWQQGAWSLCLEQGTFEVDVSAGKIAYLGTFNVDQMLLEIQKSAVQDGKTIVSGSDYYLKRDANVTPVVTGRSEGDLKEAGEFAQTVMGGTGNLVMLAAMNGTAFGTSGFGKAMKICG